MLTKTKYIKQKTIWFTLPARHDLNLNSPGTVHNSLWVTLPVKYIYYILCVTQRSFKFRFTIMICICILIINIQYIYIYIKREPFEALTNLYRSTLRLYTSRRLEYTYYVYIYSARSIYYCIMYPSYRILYVCFRRFRSLTPCTTVYFTTCCI